MLLEGEQRQFQEGPRSKNANTLERIKREEVGVARDDVSCLTAHREFHELVVLRIARRRNLDLDLDQFCLAGQGRDKVTNILLVDVTAEPFATQNFVRFSENGNGQ